MKQSDDLVKPIFTLGRYQVIHRNNQDYDKVLENNLQTPFFFKELQLIANFGIMLSIMYFLIKIIFITGVTTSSFIIFTMAFIVSIIAFKAHSFLLLFKIIDTKINSQENKPNAKISIAHWAYVIFLATLTILWFCLEYFINIPSSSILMNVIFALLIVAGLPYSIFCIHNTLIK